MWARAGPDPRKGEGGPSLLSTIDRLHCVLQGVNRTFFHPSPVLSGHHLIVLEGHVVLVVFGEISLECHVDNLCPKEG